MGGAFSIRPLLAGTVEQTGGYNFYIKGKNKIENSSFSSLVHNSALNKEGVIENDVTQMRLIKISSSTLLIEVETGWMMQWKFFY